MVAVSNVNILAHFYFSAYFFTYFFRYDLLQFSENKNIHKCCFEGVITPEVDI